MNGSYCGSAPPRSLRLLQFPFSEYHRATPGVEVRGLDAAGLGATVGASSMTSRDICLVIARREAPEGYEGEVIAQT